MTTKISEHRFGKIKDREEERKMKKFACASLIAITVALSACQGQNPPAGDPTPTPEPTVSETTFNANVPAVVPADGGTSDTATQ